MKFCTSLPLITSFEKAGSKNAAGTMWMKNTSPSSSVPLNCWILFLNMTSAFISFHPKYSVLFVPKLQSHFFWGGVETGENEPPQQTEGSLWLPWLQPCLPHVSITECSVVQCEHSPHFDHTALKLLRTRAIPYRPRGAQQVPKFACEIIYVSGNFIYFYLFTFGVCV